MAGNILTDSGITFDQSGWMDYRMAETWQHLRYYLTGSGAMATGWINLGGTWYYLNGSGARQPTPGSVPVMSTVPAHGFLIT